MSTSTISKAFMNLIKSSTANENSTDLYSIFARWGHDENEDEFIDEQRFANLLKESDSFAYNLQVQKNLKKGDCAILCYYESGNSPLGFLSSFLGCIKAGITVVLLEDNDMSDSLDTFLPNLTKVVDNYNAKLIIVDSKVQGRRLADQFNLFSESRHLWPKQSFKVNDFGTMTSNVDDTGEIMVFNNDTSSTTPNSDVTLLDIKYRCRELLDPKTVILFGTYRASNSNERSIILTTLNSQD